MGGAQGTGCPRRGGRGRPDDPRDPARPAPAVPRRPLDGPGGVYEDRTPDYVTREVALDYAASTVLLLAAVGPR
jgi:hypothetical protein